MVSEGFVSRPSTLSRIPPKGDMVSPAAVTAMSAVSSWPDFSRMPVLVNRSMWSVTTEARPAEVASNRSPSGTTHSRWSQGA